MDDLGVPPFLENPISVLFGRPIPSFFFPNQKHAQRWIPFNHK
jgi:hypothetical protein